KAGGTQNLTSAGLTLTFAIYFIGYGTTFALQDNLVSNLTLNLVMGTLNDNNHNVTANFVVAPLTAGNTTAARVWNKGTGTYTVAGPSTIWNVTASNT